MLLFCPNCSMMLIVKVMEAHTLTPQEKALGWEGKNAFECRCCPYRCPIDRKYYERKYMEMKEVDDILGGADSWKNVDKTEVKCPNDNCDSREAYFRQVQIRSADEPMTSFYKCTACAKDWREN